MGKLFQKRRLLRTVDSIVNKEIDKMLLQSGIDPNTLKPIAKSQKGGPSTPQPTPKRVLPSMSSMPEEMQAATGTLPGVPDIATTTELPPPQPVASAPREEPRSQGDNQLMEGMPNMVQPLPMRPFTPQRFVEKKETIINNSESPHKAHGNDDGIGSQLKANLDAINSNPVQRPSEGLSPMFSMPLDPVPQSSGPKYMQITPNGQFQPDPMYRRSTLPEINNDFQQQRPLYRPQPQPEQEEAHPSRDHQELVEVKRDMSDLKNQLSSLTQLLQAKFSK